MPFEPTPYCGPPPAPDLLASRWNFDPWLMIGFAALALAWYVAGRTDRHGRQAFGIAALLAIVAFMSPLCALTTALFSARVAHHLLLIAAIAPLLAIALPWRSGPRLPLSALVLGHALIVWAWHAPASYAWALDSGIGYWLMQGTLLGSAWLLWRGAVASTTAAGPAAFAMLATIMQMGFLGALLVFANRPLYEPHLETTLPFGLSPQADQQLAGLLMWVPAFIPYAAYALRRSVMLFEPGRRAPAP